MSTRKDRILKTHWLAEPEHKDYPAAESYLTLLYKRKRVRGMIAKLKKAEMVAFKAKDIFRASGLSLLGISNYHVDKDRKKIENGIRLSPLLLVRGRRALVIADGYHRLCAIYAFNEDEKVPCKII